MKNTTTTLAAKIDAERRTMRRDRRIAADRGTLLVGVEPNDLRYPAVRFLTATQVATTMRRASVTIKALASAGDITQKLVRSWRADGIDNDLDAWAFRQLIHKARAAA